MEIKPGNYFFYMPGEDGPEFMGGFHFDGNRIKHHDPNDVYLEDLFPEGELNIGTKRNFQKYLGADPDYGFLLSENVQKSLDVFWLDVGTYYLVADQGDGPKLVGSFKFEEEVIKIEKNCAPMLRELFPPGKLTVLSKYNLLRCLEEDREYLAVLTENEYENFKKTNTLEKEMNG